LPAKKSKKRDAQSGNLARVSARPKLTASRETRLLAFGESFEASCCAINVSSTAVRKRAQRGAEFAERLAAAREHRAPTLVERAGARSQRNSNATTASTGSCPTTVATRSTSLTSTRWRS
jgi:hypothetical protein